MNSIFNVRLEVAGLEGWLRATITIIDIDGNDKYRIKEMMPKVQKIAKFLEEIDNENI
jgi:hypothetical protein